MTSTTARPARLRIDWTRCQGRGACIDLLPELLTEDPWGYPVARPGLRDGAAVAVPAELLPEVRSAVGRCPRLALLLDGDR
jgi:ferredoxin